MSGHSKWSTIKRKKAAVDAKRGKLFTRLLKEVQIAARVGGGSVEANPRLKTAVQNAKSNSVPGDNIEKAIKRGTGDLEGVDYEEVVYEGYGPAGVAVMVECLTDNRNRTVAEVRHVFSKSGGNLGGANAVAHVFSQQGVLFIKSSAVDEEELFDKALEAGAEDIQAEEDGFEVYCPPEVFETVRDAVAAIAPDVEGEIRQVPQTSVQVSGKDAESVLRMIDLLDDLDDVQNVVANFDIDDEELAKLTDGS